MSVSIEVSMFGGTRAGKTTLLTQMMQSIRSEVEAVGLDLTIPPATVAVFEAAQRQLEDLVVAVYDGKSGGGHGIAGSVDLRSYEVGLSNKHGTTAAQMTFTDYPGEKLATTSGTPDDAVWQKLKRSVLLVAINTPVMMEAVRDPAFDSLHKRSNWPDQLDNVLRDASPAPPVVVFCPIKCERWLNEDPSGATLRDAVKEKYRKPLATIARRDIAACVIPVVTIGSIEFDRLENTGPPGLPPSPNHVMECYRPVGASQGLEPRLNDQPLRIVLWALSSNVSFKALARAHFKAGDLGRAVTNTFGRVIEGLGVNEGRLHDYVAVEGGRDDYLRAAKALADRILSDPPVYEL